MIFSTFYFSGTGNTKWVAEQFNISIAKSGHQARLYPVESLKKGPNNLLKDIFEESDCLGFATPIYGANLPPIMRSLFAFLTEALKEEPSGLKSVFMISTFGYVNALGPFEAKKFLDKKHLKLTAYVNIRMCNNVSTDKHRAKIIEKEKLDQRKKQAQKKIEVLVNRLLSSKKYIRGIGPYLLPGFLIRRKTGPAVQNHYKHLGVQLKTCSQCMRCIDNCPTQSIRMIDQKFEFSDGCTSCMRCYNFCPTCSILVDGVFTDPAHYRRYRGPY